MDATLVFLAVFLLAEPGAGLALTREEVLDRVHVAAVEGVELDRLRTTWNFLSRKVRARYPLLVPLGLLSGVPAEFTSEEDLAAFLFEIQHSGDFASVATHHRLLERWLEEGRLRTEEAVAAWIENRDEWRRVARARAEALAPPERGPPPEPEARRRARPAGRSREPVVRLRWSPRLLRTVLSFVEDFLGHYGTGETPEGTAPSSGGDFLKLLLAGGEPPAQAPPAFEQVCADPDVVRGLSRLFHDLTLELLGIDTDLTAELVAGLPAGEGWTIVLGGYGSPAEAIALPFHRLATDFFQLHFGRRMEVAWLERREDLERILLDPSVRAVFLAGHGAMDGYSHAGLKGKPEETLARLLAWLRAQGDETLAPLAEALEADVERLPVALQDHGFQWEHWELEDFRGIAAGAGFRKKDRMVLYACGSGEIVVGPEGALGRYGPFRKALYEELRTHADAWSWLGVESRGSGYALSPLCPAAAERFEAGLPDLVRSVRRRLGGPLQVEAVPDFLELLAVDFARYRGEAWGHDFVERPEGHVWSAGRLAVKVRRSLEEGGEASPTSR